MTWSVPACTDSVGDNFEHETGHELFGSNLLALTWIKGDAMPGDLVDEILRGLGLERETDEQQRRRTETRMHMRERSQQSGVRSSGLAQLTDEQCRRSQNLRRLESSTFGGDGEDDDDDDGTATTKRA